MIAEVENIILSKEYFELTAEELSAVTELVQNADEYDEMKWFLASSQQVLVGEKIEATVNLRKKVIEHLNKDERSRRFWLNGVGVFLFPADKRFYQKPAFQMSLVAILLIGFLLVYNRPINEGSMALNETALVDDQEMDGINEPKDDGVEEIIEQHTVGANEKMEEIRVNRSLASEEVFAMSVEINELDLPEQEFDHPDGIYKPLKDQAPEFLNDFGEGKGDKEVVTSKSNANNNELENKLLQEDNLGKQLDKSLRNDFNKSERQQETENDKNKKLRNKMFLKKAKREDDMINASNSRQTAIEADRELGNNSGNNSAGNTNTVGMGTKNETPIPEYANGKIVGLKNEGNTNNGYYQPNNVNLVGGNVEVNQNMVDERESEDDNEFSFDGTVLEDRSSEEKENNKILLHQLYADDTKELKQFFKTFK